MIKNNCIILLFFLNISVVQAQVNPIKEMSLKQAYSFAQDNYPAIKGVTLINQIEKINLELIVINKLPLITLNGIGQLQSESVEIGSPNSPIFIDAPLGTFNANVAVDYNLYDGGISIAQKDVKKAEAEINRQLIQVKLRSLKDRVNKLFFAILLSRNKNQLFQIALEDLEAKITMLQVGYNNGVVLESELSKLKVRKLELNSEIIKSKGNLKSYVKLLEKLLGKELLIDIVLVLPLSNAVISDTDKIKRPEQQLFDSKKTFLSSQEKILKAKTKPKVSLFAKGGLGYPNPLNFTDINTSLYALGGVKIKWIFLDYSLNKKEQNLIRMRQEQVDIDKEIFIFELSSKRKKIGQKVLMIEEQISNNLKIVVLQDDILKQSSVQLENGIINSNDYVIQVNATLRAKQQLELNKTQLEQIKIEYLTLIGKL